jgi:hypothetical protein
MYKEIKAAIKPLIKDEELYKKVKAEIKKAVAQHKDYAKIFEEGAELTADKFDGSDEETEFLMENQIGFRIASAIEMHIYNPKEFAMDAIWPSASVENGKIVLRSAFGWAKEDEIICESVFVEAF